MPGLWWALDSSRAPGSPAGMQKALDESRAHHISAVGQFEGSRRDGNGNGNCNGILTGCTGW